MYPLQHGGFLPPRTVKLMFPSGFCWETTFLLYCTKLLLSVCLLPSSVVLLALCVLGKRTAFILIEGIQRTILNLLSSLGIDFWSKAGLILRSFSHSISIMKYDDETLSLSGVKPCLSAPDGGLPDQFLPCVICDMITTAYLILLDMVIRKDYCDSGSVDFNI